MGILRPIFRRLAIPAMVGAMSVATPAWASEDAANSNATVVAASVSTAPARMTKPLYKDVSKLASKEAILQELANVSIDKVAIVVWGGNRTLQQEAWNASLDLVRDGIPTVMVVAPDHNSLPQDAIFQIYAKSLPQGQDGHFGTDHADKVRVNMYENGKYAYRKNYTQQVAGLNLN